MNTLLPAVGLLATLGIVFGISLAVAARKLAVESDPRIDEIETLLPGANCGACGYPGCRGLAEAMVAGSAQVNACPVTKDYSPLAEVMGVKVEASKDRRVAKVRCAGGKKETKERFRYIGVADCASAIGLAGGFKVCAYGCLGLGSCANTCPFAAITMNENGLPVVDEEKCTGCGLCAKACPRRLITLASPGAPVTVLCRNQEKGAGVRKACQVGCIGCGLCVKNCPEQAIIIEENVAVIDPKKCSGCGICLSKCPTKAISGKLAAKADVQAG